MYFVRILIISFILYFKDFNAKLDRAKNNIKDIKCSKALHACYLKIVGKNT